MRLGGMHQLAVAPIAKVTLDEEGRFLAVDSGGVITRIEGDGHTQVVGRLSHSVGGVVARGDDLIVIGVDVDQHRTTVYRHGEALASFPDTIGLADLCLLGADELVIALWKWAAIKRPGAWGCRLIAI